jgi:peptidoglycan/xylan/chitin deacetylase (PgdA/CDA1 family)
MLYRWYVTTPLFILTTALWLLWAVPSAPALSQVTTTTRMVALTFDDGPSAHYTPAILKLLSEYHAAATFFVLGSQAERYPGVVKREIAQGSEVANHGWGHLNLRQVGALAMWQDAQRTSRILASLGVSESPFYRPPYGMMSTALLRIFESHGYTVTLWSIDTRDWTSPGVGNMTATIQRQMKPGAIILMHDGGGKREQTLAALRWLLSTYTRRGWRFVTLSQLTHPGAVAVSTSRK